MLELFTKKPVFQGSDEIHQLDMIYKIIGTPTNDRWPGLVDLPWYELVKPRDVVSNHFRELFHKFVCPLLTYTIANVEFRWMSPAAMDLAEQLLAYDPSLRSSATQAMQAPYFISEDPPAAAPVGCDSSYVNRVNTDIATSLATLEGEWHELETKRERSKKRKKD